MLSARGSQLEREFGFGAVRQLFEGTLCRPRRDVPSCCAAPRPRAASVFDEVTADPTERADGSFAVLHGLYWLTVNLAEQRPVRARRRRPAVVRHRLVALPRLPAAAGSRDCRCSSSRLCAPARRTRTRRCSPSSPRTSRRCRCTQGRSAPRRAADLVRAAARRARATPRSSRPATGRPAATRCCCASCCAPCEVEGVRPDASHADTVNAIGSRAVSSMVLMRLAPAAGGAAPRWRARSPCSATAAELPAVAALAGWPETTSDAAAPRRPGPRRGAARRVTRSASCTRWSRDAVYRDAVRRRARAAPRARGRPSSRRHGAAPEQVAAHLMLAPRRGAADAVAVLRTAAATAAERGAADAAAPATWSGRWPSRPAPTSDPRSWSSSAGSAR